LFSHAALSAATDSARIILEAEANATGTEDNWIDPLPAEGSASVHKLLKSYLKARVLF
jgi:hypothetical protein